MAFVDASYILEVKAKERPDLPGLGTDPIFTHQITGLVGTLTSTSPVPATKVFSGQVTLSGGALEFQLDTLTDLEGDALTLTGLKVQLAFFRNQGGNAVIDIEDGTANPYFLFSDAAGQKVSLLAGQAILLFGNEASPDVGSGASDIKLTGTGSEKIDVIIVAG